MFARKLFSVAAVLAGSVVSVGLVAPAGASAAPGDGLLVINSTPGVTNSCQGTDAATADWTWTKPSLEYSTNGGSTYASAAASAWGMVVCRATTPVPQYQFIVGPSTGSIKDMLQAGLAPGLQFRITIPAKPGDSITYAVGYSSMVSFVEQNSSAVIVSRPAGLSKINFDSFDNFKTRHPECATYSMQDWQKCSITKSDEDITATIIQHVGFSTTTLNSMEQDMKGLWIGANVNSFRIGMSCSGRASSQGVRKSEDITVGGKTYTRLPNGNFRGTDGKEYTQNELAALSGGSSGGGSTGGSSDPSLTVSMEGTPHLKLDGSLNKGSMKAFIPATIAKKCFGKSDGSSVLSAIASALTVSRQEAKEGTTTPQFTVEAVTAPVEGLLVTVAEMTFSNPEYTIKSSLSAYVASNTATTQTGSSTGAGKSNYALAKAGSKATISVTLVAAVTFKVYRKTTANGTATLLKTVKGKKGLNKVLTTWKKGYVFIIRSSKGTQLATLK